MQNDDRTQHIQTWWSKDLARHLDIGESTVRKWSIELEKAGYEFLRDEHNRRTYIERDAIALRQMKDYLAAGMSYSNASQRVANQYRRIDELNNVTGSANDNLPANPSLTADPEVINELKDMLKAMYIELSDAKEQIKALNEVVNAQKQIAAGSTSAQEERDRERSEKLDEVLRELREIREEKNKSVWSRLFGR
ncbi:hypothetical protein [Paenibacillus gansuensis]|uniref:HTH merR-type domain-containing protein n=1 Tax=Paenibacillus gansuensis TaxID=306542 RepID=A0ABW5PK78_9BACL